MVKLIFIFLVIAALAALLGFSSIAFISFGIAKIIFFVFVVLCLFTLLFYITGTALAILAWAIIFFTVAIIAAVISCLGFALIITGVKVIFYLHHFIAITRQYACSKTIKEIRRAT